MRTTGARMSWVAGMACVLAQGQVGAGGITPVLSSTQSVEQAAAVPPVAVATSVTDGGRFVLATVVSKGFRPGGSGQGPEIVLLDMETGARTLVSVAPDGGGGDGASGGGQMGTNGHRVVFDSRASNLVPGDTNAAWDVFVRDMDVGQTRLVDFGTNGTVLRGQTTCPQLSGGGRWVLADHADQKLGSRSKLLKDLETGAVVAFGGNPAGDPAELWDARFASKTAWMVGLATGGSQLAGGFGILRHDLQAGTNAVVVSVPRPHWFGSPAISADGRYLAWCKVERSSAATTNSVECFDAETGEIVEVASRTNQWSWAARDTWSLLPAWSPEGRWLVCALPEQRLGTTNLFSQLYLWNRETRELMLITEAAEGGESGLGDSVLPLVGPGASNVVFLSNATNLVAGGLTPGRRVFRWDRALRTTSVLLEVPDDRVLPEPALSGDARHLAVAEAGRDGAVTVRVVAMENGAGTERTFLPAVTNSATQRGLVSLSGTASSMDGRWLACVGVPDEATPAQVYLVDTLTGDRRLVSQGVDGKPAAANCWGVRLSADGERVAFLSAATNLVAEKTGSWSDIFVYSRSQGQFLSTTAMWRGTNVASATANFALSPDGRWLALESDMVRVVDLNSGASGLLSRTGLRARPAFSADGTRVLFDAVATTDRTVAVHDVPLLGSGQTSVVWATNGLSAIGASVLSPDGKRLAFAVPGGLANRYRLTVLDVGTGATVFLGEIPGPARGGLFMRGDGGQIVWEALGAVAQVWSLDLGTGDTQLLSVGDDGTSPGDGSSRFPVISPDGRWVAFASTAGNLVPGGEGGMKQVYLRDTSFRRTFQVSRGSDGKGGDGWSTLPWFQGTGSTLRFLSASSDLVAGDLNMIPDVFSVVVVDAGELIVLVEPAAAAGKSRLRWSGKPGLNYGLQFKDAIQDVWQDLPGILGPDATVEVDQAAGARFFRVIERQ